MPDRSRDRDELKASAAAPAPPRGKISRADRYARAGEELAQREDRMQDQQDARRKETEKSQQKGEQESQAVQAGAVKHPTNPFPEQHLEKPGLESELEPAPQYEAPKYRGSGKLEGKVALITGGDSGIGRSVAVLYAREGADVAIVYLSEDSDAETTAQAVAEEGRRCLLIPGDVGDADFCSYAVEQTVKELGKLNILVNNAAYQQHQASLDDITEEQWDRTFRTNIYGYFHMAKAAVPHLQNGDAIVNTASVTAFDGNASLLDYASTKGAIAAFTRALAHSLVSKGIRVNGVAPGPVWTPLNPADVPAEKVANFGHDTAMKRPAQPEEIAPSYVFLASPVDSSYITGEIIMVTGGAVVP